MGALSSSSPLILRCVFRLPPPSTATHISSLNPFFSKFFSHLPPVSFSTPLLPISHTTLSPSTPRSLSTSTQSTIVPGEETQLEIDDDSETGIDDHDEPTENEEENPVDIRISSAHKEMLAKLKGMSTQEKKELGSYAHSLGKKLKSQQIGKSGITDKVATALVETLEANELLKIKILNNCPGELDDVVNQLEKATGSVVVGKIGRAVIIYRPSLTKLQAEEKKKQAQKIFLKRKEEFRSSFRGRKLSRGQSSTPSSRKPWRFQ